MSSLNLGTGVVSPSSGAYVWPAPDLIKIRLVCRRLIFIHHAIWCWGIFTKSIIITCSQLPPLGVTSRSNGLPPPHLHPPCHLVLGHLHQEHKHHLLSASTPRGHPPRSSPHLRDHA